MITLGAQLIHEFSWIIYVFSVFMIFTGIKMFFMGDKKIDINENVLLKWIRKHFRITKEIKGERFFVLQNNEKNKKPYIFITPLFVSLILVEFTDLVFAVDSIPAIFTITEDPYIVYTSNIPIAPQDAKFVESRI